MLDQLLGEAERRGIDVVLLELPSNSEVIGDAFDWARDMYVPEVKPLAEKHGVPYVDFNAELPLTNDDFHDLSHLVEPGRVDLADAARRGAREAARRSSRRQTRDPRRRRERDREGGRLT